MVDRTAAVMIYPYLAWVSFATILNLSIVILN
ncbi:MAG: tryptophan-rich sensory protein [Flavobacteriaceae bacterium]